MRKCKILSVVQYRRLALGLRETRHLGPNIMDQYLTWLAKVYCRNTYRVSEQSTDHLITTHFVYNVDNGISSHIDIY